MSDIEEKYLAALCLLGRYRGRLTKTHPARCAMCDRSTEELEEICSRPVMAGERAEWSKLTKHERAERLDEVRGAAGSQSYLDLDL